MRNINFTKLKDTMKRNIFIQGILLSIAFIITYLGFFYCIDCYCSYKYEAEKVDTLNGYNWEVDYITSSKDKDVYYYHLTNGEVYTYKCKQA